MTAKTPHRCILVSNDDGIFAPGLLALASAMREFGRVVVIGPEENQSANGHRKTLTKPLRVTPVKIGENIEAYSTDGAPADCIAIALIGLLGVQADLVVSGINRGPNLGQDLTYSGTVAAAFEGTIHGKPSIAFSLDSRSLEADYSAAAQVARRVAAQVLEHGLPPMTLLNVNIPYLPTIRSRARRSRGKARASITTSWSRGSIQRVAHTTGSAARRPAAMSALKARISGRCIRATSRSRRCIWI